jgi:peptidoglycan/LPS O-acetylase OafA/YrhL
VARRLITVLNVLSIISITWLLVSRETCPFPLNRWYQFGLGIALFTLVNRGMVRAVGGELFSATAVIVLVLAYGFVVAPAIPVYAGYTERTLVLCIVAFVCSILVLARHEHNLCGNSLFSIFQKLGRMSYSLYLFHMIPMPFMDAGLRRMGLSGELYIFNYMLQIAVALLSGWLFFRLVESRCLNAKNPSPSLRSRHP